jgi:cytochrome c biogenesis protein CcdA
VHRSRIVILAGVGVAGLALFLPQARFPIIGNPDGFTADTWPVMLPLVPVAVLALVGDRGEGHRLPAAAVGLLLSCAALAFAVAKVIDAVAAVGSIETAAVGVGTWAVAAGAALAVLGSLLAFSRRIG